MTPVQVQILRDTLIRIARDAQILFELGFAHEADALLAQIEDITLPVGDAPMGASAWKYADPTEGARWIFDDNEAAAIENVDPSLIVWVAG